MSIAKHDKRRCVISIYILSLGRISTKTSDEQRRRRETILFSIRKQEQFQPQLPNQAHTKQVEHHHQTNEEQKSLNLCLLNWIRNLYRNLSYRYHRWILLCLWLLQMILRPVFKKRKEGSKEVVMRRRKWENEVERGNLPWMLLRKDL